MNQRFKKILAEAGIGLLYLYLLAPMLVVILFSFSEKSFFEFPPKGFSLAWYVRAWESGIFVGPALRSVIVALLSTLIAALAAIPAALAIRRAKGRAWANAYQFLLLSPLIIPALISGIALLYFFNQWGLIDTFAGLLFAHVILVLPFMFRSVLVSIHDLQPQFEEASEILGAAPMTTFRRVVLPAIAPGLAAGASFAFIVSFDQFAISLFVTQSQQTTLPVAIYKYLFDVNDPVVAAVSTVLVGFGFLATVLMQKAGMMKNVAGSGG